MNSARMMAIMAVLAALLVLSMSVFTVKETEKAILFQLGKIVATDFAPGMHFKMPFITNVRKFESRIMVLDGAQERYLTSEKKNVIVDVYVKWRIDDVAKYFTSVRGDESQAGNRIAQVVKDSLRSEFGKRTIQEVISGERAEIMGIVTGGLNKQAQEFGVSVIDVRLKRIDLPEDVSESVYRRMEAERSRVAKELRSQGAEQAERIRADADRQGTGIRAEAYRVAERVRGEGDAQASEIYAKAYNKDPEFFSFYRSLQAYRESFRDSSDLMVVDPQADFFRYFKHPKGGRK